MELLEKADDFPELSYTDWLCDLAKISAFKTKPALFAKENVKQVFHSFLHTGYTERALRHVKEYWKPLDDLYREFGHLFSDFRKTDKSLQLVSCPFTQESETSLHELQWELIQLQCHTVLKEKFNSFKMNEFYASLSKARFLNIQMMARRTLVLIGSTYVCEQTFSVMNTNKAPHRSQLSDKNLRSIQRIATN